MGLEEFLDTKLKEKGIKPTPIPEYERKKDKREAVWVVEYRDGSGGRITLMEMIERRY